MKRIKDVNWYNLGQLVPRFWAEFVWAEWIQNMRRHVKTFHADFKDDETIDDREDPEIIDEEDASDKADDDEPNIKDKSKTDDSDIDVAVEEAAEEKEEEEEGKEEDSDDPWRLLIEEAFGQCQSEFDERVTKHMAR